MELGLLYAVVTMVPLLKMWSFWPVPSSATLMNETNWLRPFPHLCHWPPDQRAMRLRGTEGLSVAAVKLPPT